jgi:WASH complex subunit strumpellin
METRLVFKTGKIQDLEVRLRELATALDGFRRSFQYIQDYVNIQGLRIWQEEFSRIVNFYVEQECNQFLKKKVLEWQSSYQDEAIPIPVFNRQDKESVNMVGRFTRELLDQTNYRRTFYLDQMSAWFDPGTVKELVGLKTFAQLQRSVGVYGICGLDRLLCFMTVKELQSFTTVVRYQVEKHLKKDILNFENELHPTTQVPNSAEVNKIYSYGLARTKSLVGTFLETVTKVGQMQLIRRQIANLLNYSGKLDSNGLYCALDNLNKAMVGDIKMHYINPDAVPYPSEDNPLLSELSKYLETTGLHDPYSKIYITTSPLSAFPCLMFLFVISQATKYAYSPSYGAILHKKQKDFYDWIPLVVGVLTMLRQFHSLHTQQFLAYLGQYVRAYINEKLGAKEGKVDEYPEEVTAVLLFLEDFCRIGHVERKMVEGYFPAYIFDNFKR